MKIDHYTSKAIDSGPASDDLPIPLFARYRPSHRLALTAYTHTLYTGFATCGLGLLFVWAFWGRPQWLNWSMLGIATGVLMLLHGARLLPRTAPHRYSMTQWIASQRESWFGLFIFFCQNLFMFCLGSMLWFSLPVIGVPLHASLHIAFFLALGFITLRRLLLEWALCHPGHTHDTWHEIVRWTTAIIVTLLIAIATSHAISPLGHPITGDTTLLIVIIWLLAGFTILCCVILLVDRVRRRIDPATNRDRP